ncbi:MAG: hypothetical protein ACRDFC_01945, partial [Ignavibacteria bacterium]
MSLMLRGADKNYFYISIAFLTAVIYYLITEYIITDKQFGVPLDDTWIHFRYAENFAKGFFFHYNINEPTPGTSSPLWVIILSPAFFFSINPTAYSLIISSIFFLLTCIEVYKLCLKFGLERNFALIAALITLLSGRLLWSSLSGMEITLFCFLSVLIIRLHLYEIENKKLYKLQGLFLGLASITRPEGLLLTAVYFTVSIILFRKSLKENFINLFTSVFLFLITISPYAVFSYLQTGGFLPNTFKGQGGELRFLPDVNFLRETGQLFFGDNLLILFLWFASILYFFYTIFKGKIEIHFLIINLWLILLPLISSILVPNWRHHGRYLIPLIPFVNIISVHLVQKIYAGFKKKNLKTLTLIRNAFVTILFLLTIKSTVIFANAIGWNADNINKQQVNIANWLNNNLTEEKAFGLNDIGAITFITKKRIVDMAGLVTPEVF